MVGLKPAAHSPPGAQVFQTSPIPFAVRGPRPGEIPSNGQGVAVWFSVSGDVDQYRADVLRRGAGVGEFETGLSAGCSHLLHRVGLWSPCMPERREILGRRGFRRSRWAAVAGGFVQLGHGKVAPVRRLSPGDVLALYSPRTQMRAGTTVHSFTAIASVCDGDPYLFQQTPSFSPIRRDVTYFDAQAAPIEPLLEKLSFIRSQEHWGMALRRGLVEVSESDMKVIAEAMSVRQGGLFLSVARRARAVGYPVG